MQTIIGAPPFNYEPSRKKRPKPYVGATGFTTTWDVEEAIDYFYKYRDGKPHVFMMGFLLSHKVIDLGTHPDEWKRGRYPDLTKIVHLLESAEYDDVFRVIHYNTKSNDIYKEVSYFLKELGWKNIVDGIQFNVQFPPSREEIDLIASEFPKLKIILQINNGAFVKYANFDDIVNAITDHNADYILIDPSAGSGKDIDIGASVDQYHAVKSRMNSMIGFAGGFTPDNVRERVSMYKQLLGSGERFCIDAESGLMDDKNKMDMNKVEMYLKNFFQSV